MATLKKQINADVKAQKLFDYRIKYNYCLKCGIPATTKLHNFPLCDICLTKIKKEVGETKIAVENFIKTGIWKK